MITTLLEATEMIGLPIILLSGFMLIALLALLMVILRKEKSYEDIVREREMKLGDIGEGLFVYTFDVPKVSLLMSLHLIYFLFIYLFTYLFIFIFIYRQICESSKEESCTQT